MGLMSYPIKIKLLIRIIRNNITISLIVLLGILLRFIGIYPGYYLFGDEVLYGAAVGMILNNTLATDIFGYPPLIPWVMLFFFSIFFIPIAWVIHLSTHFAEIFVDPSGALKSIDFELADFSKIFVRDILGKYTVNAMYWARYVTALMGVGAVLLTYLVSKSFFKNQLMSLVAAFLVAVNFRLVLNTRLGLPDIYNSFFLLFSLWAIGRLIDKPVFKRYIFAWVSVGLFFLTKYQVYALMPLFLAHLYLSIQSSFGEKTKLSLKKKALSFAKELFNKGFLFGGVICLLIVLIAHYHYYPHWERIVEINQYEALKYGFGRNMLNTFPIAYLFNYGLGPLIFIFTILGFVYGVCSKNLRISSVILSSVFPIPFFLYFYYTSGGFYTRNLIALIPIFLIFASLFVVTIYKFFLTFTKSLVLAYVLIVVLVVILAKNHLGNDLINIREYTNESKYFQAHRWVAANIPPSSKLTTFDATFDPDDRFVVKKLYAPNKVVSYQELKEEGDDYVVFDIYFIQGYLIWWMHQPPGIGLKFWRKPSDLLSQNYLSLSARELLWSKTIKAFLTPWQAPDYSYAIVKVKEDTFSKDISFGNFDSRIEWNKLAYLENYKNFLKIVEVEGKMHPVITAVGNILPGGVRWGSNLIAIKPGHGYKITGWVRNSLNIGKEARDGFLRMDFYKDQKPVEVLSRSQMTFISRRVYGDVSWHKVEVEAVAPEDSRYASLGFQADSPSVDFELGGVEIKETIEPFSGKLSRYTISDDDLFFPNDGVFQ